VQHDFDSFKALAGLCGVQAKRCTEYHWQLTGARHRVDFWPTSKGGPRMAIVGNGRSSRRGTAEDAIELAGPVKPTRIDEPAAVIYAPPVDRVPDPPLINPPWYVWVAMSASVLAAALRIILEGFGL
jgi:hypothetical protein